MKTLDKVLLAVGIFIALFIIAMIVIFCIKGETPDTLIQCTLGAGGIEVILTAVITVFKIRNKQQKKDEEETEQSDNEDEIEELEEEEE